jgi:hypothetical protein
MIDRSVKIVSGNIGLKEQPIERAMRLILLVSDDIEQHFRRKHTGFGVFLT